MSFLSSCNECIDGYGEIVTENFRVDDYKRLTIGIPANVVIQNGDSASIKITTYESYMIALNKKVHGDRLDLDGNFCFAENDDIKILLTIPNELETIVVNGTANVSSNKPCKSEEINIIINGSGNIALNIFTNRVFSNINGTGNLNLSGTCQNLSVGIAGSGNFKGINLNTYKAKINIAGSGHATVVALNELDAIVNGSGVINYSGEPDISISISGSGKVNKID